MRVGAFEIDDSARGLRNPHVISTLRPWIDAGNVGKLVLARLEDRLGARSAGSLVQPGQFFDFTRYRPVVRYRGDERTFVVPNTTVSYVRRREEPDFLFLDLLEPHSHAEDYIESIMELISSLGVRVHWRIGAWYGGVPHTRPLRVGRSLRGVQVDARTGRPSGRTRRYEGPTSIMSIMNDQFERAGIESNSLMLQVPHYGQLEEDYTGAAAMLAAVGETYGLSAELEESILGLRARGARQYEQLDAMVAGDRALRAMVEQLEGAYDAEELAASPRDHTPPLSPEIERFLGEVTERMDSGETGD